MRQHNKYYKDAKKAAHKVNKSRRSKSNNSSKIATNTQEYISIIDKALSRVEHVVALYPQDFRVIKIKEFLKVIYLLRDQVIRRLINGEIIPPSEKIYSIHKPHTEWVNKGKIGNKVELGVKTCIIESDDGFILNHMVMYNKMDVDIAVEFITNTKKIFPSLSSCSFDKGFHSPSNQEELSKIITTIMPIKGKRNKDRARIETSEEFSKLRRKHSAVESAINCLDHHGLDKCRNFSIESFELHIATAIAARNIQKIGEILITKELKKLSRKEKKLKKLAA